MVEDVIENKTEIPQTAPDTDQESLKNNLVPEKEERRGNSILPRIDQFPEKAQPVIREAYLKAAEDSKSITGLSESITSVIMHEKLLQQTYDKALSDSENLSPEAKAEQDKTLLLIKKELQLIQKAYATIINGQDAPELRDVPSPFEKTPIEVQFSEEELKRYGKPKNLTGAVKRLSGMFSAKDPQEYKAFNDKLTRLFRKRISDLFTYGVIQADIRPSFKSAFTVSENVLAQPKETQGEALNGEIDTYVQSVSKTISQASAYTYYLDEISKWSKEHAQELNKVCRSGIASISGSKLGGEIDQAIKLVRNEVNRDKVTFLTNISNAPHSVGNQYIGLACDKIAQLSHDICVDCSPVVYPGGQEPIGHASISHDYVELARELHLKIMEVTSLLQEYVSYKSVHLSSSIRSLHAVIYHGERQARLDDELAVSENLFIHVTPPHILKQILKTGMLASRKYQIDHFGESYFNTAEGEEVRVGKDYVKITEKGMQRTVSKAEFDSRAKALIKKTADQELYQLCFSVDSPYQYYQGVALAFSQPSLFEKSQFVHADGWHLFDSKYTLDNQNSPGFNLDITKEPMMIIVKESMKDEIEGYIRTELAPDPNWHIENIDAWLEQHMLVVPDYSHAEITGTFVEEIKSKFAQRNKLSIPKGWVVPTGEFGEDPIRQKMPLFAYQQAA